MTQPSTCDGSLVVNVSMPPFLLPQELIRGVHHSGGGSLNGADANFTNPFWLD